IKPLIFPMTAQISAIGVEYGLYQGRFWLPRVQIAEGGAGAGVMRVPFKLEQKYKYENVNAGVPLPPIVVDSTARRNRRGVMISVGGDGARDSTGSRLESTASRRDSIRAERRRARRRCDASGNRTYTRQGDEMP